MLLPGMDGTGALFYRLLAELRDMDALMVPLPQSWPQDYERLARYVKEHLPDGEFILLAESFSGGIAARLSQQEIPNLKEIIFVATFLSAPRPFLVKVARWLPLKLLSSLPFSSVAFRKWFLGGDAGAEMIRSFRRVIRSVPASVLKERLSVISKARYDGFRSLCPVVYVGAARDALVDPSKRQAFADAYSNSTFEEIDGPHFILQARSAESAAVIRKAVSNLQGL